MAIFRRRFPNGVVKSKGYEIIAISRYISQTLQNTASCYGVRIRNLTPCAIQIHDYYYYYYYYYLPQLSNGNIFNNIE